MNSVIIGWSNGLLPVGWQAIPEPVMTYCHFDPWEQISVKFQSFSIMFDEVLTTLARPQTGDKLLPEPMIIILYETIWDHQATMC